MDKDQERLEALADRLGVTLESLLSPSFRREVGAMELDAVERTLSEESRESHSGPA